jgi:hypothetical protein
MNIERVRMRCSKPLFLSLIGCNQALFFQGYLSRLSFLGYLS